MRELFKFIITSSLYASIVGVILLVVKRLLKNKINGKWHYAIWFILIFKLLCPFGPKSPLSLFNTTPVNNTEKIINKELVSIEEKNLNAQAVPINISNGISIPITEKSADTEVQVIDVLAYIWFGIFATMLLWVIGVNLLLRMKVKNTDYCDDRIKEIFNCCKKRMNVKNNIELVVQDKIETPALFGIIKPKILLSPFVLNAKEKDIEYILLHELAHYRRKDIAINYLLLLLQCIHWFNPIIWYCFKCIRIDIEVATDGMVITRLGEDEYKDYGKALLVVLENMANRKMMPKLISVADDKKNVKRRIEMIKMADYFKTRRRMAVIIGVLCITILSTVLLTSGIGSKGDVTNGSLKTLKESNTSVEEILKYKSKYIGDASNVSNLLGKLSFGKNKIGISLQTSKTPYTMIVNYDLTDYINADIEIRELLVKNALVLFSLIDNLDGVKFISKYGEDVYSCYAGRDEFQKSFEKDLREYAKNKIDFENFLHSNQYKTIKMHLSTKQDIEMALKVAKDYFEAFSQKKYNAMEGLSTAYHDKTYVMDNSVFGMEYAKATNITFDGMDMNGLRFFVNLDTKTARESVYVHLIYDYNFGWQVNSYSTK